ncbi:MAG: hypothetical protein Q4E56_03880 [Pseudomonadota bacterium]|nr:hypothetical protein [Pseudomonadota bacterium]
MPDRKRKNGDSVKEFLASASEARLEAERLRNKLKRLEAIATRTATAEQLAMLENMKAQSTEALIRAEKQEADVTEFLNLLPNAAYRAVLKLRYCEGLEWTGAPLQRTVQSEIAKVSPAYTYSERSIYRIHGEALRAARELYKEKQDGKM